VVSGSPIWQLRLRASVSASDGGDRFRTLFDYGVFDKDLLNAQRTPSTTK
jgi:hypothetical protein